MSWQPYGGYTWSDEPAPATNPAQKQILAAGLGGTAATIGLYSASHFGTGAWNPMDTIIHGTALLGDMTPFGLGNTFRVPEFLSSLGSPALQGLQENNEIFSMSWNADQLKSRDTQLYLQEAFGLDTAKLADAGITPDMHGTNAASELIFERGANSPRGSLFTKVGTEKKLLSRSVALMKMTRDSPDLLHDGKSMNRAAFGVMQALDMWKHPSFNAERVLNDGAKAVSKWMPIPSIAGEANSLGDLGRRTALLRAYPAFEIERFSRLASGTAYQMFGDGAGKAFTTLTGMGLENLPGPVSSSFMRIGGRVALAGAAVGAVSQLDWLRRDQGFGGQVIASGAISGGIGYAVSKLGGTPKTAQFAAVASFFGQMVLPGFDQGIVPGVATAYTRSQTLRANAANPVNYYRRTLEGYAPGITSWQTGALFGIGIGIAAYGGAPQRIIDHFGHSALGLPKDVSTVAGIRQVSTPKTARDLFWSGVRKDPTINKAFDLTGYSQTPNLIERIKLGSKIIRGHEDLGNATNRLSRLNTIWDSATESHRQNAASNPMNALLTNRLDELVNKYSDNSFITRIQKEAHGFASQTYYSFLGADATETATKATIEGLGYGRVPLPDLGDWGKSLGIPKDLPVGPTGRLGRLATLGVAAFGLHQLVTGGFLGSLETADTLRAQYSGQELVEVKKSRYWEGGGTPFSGGSTKYFRPHAYHLMMNRVREKGIWGEDSDHYSPIRKFFIKNFTYGLEQQNYYDRPYPITSGAFSDVPIIGGILTSTIGKLIKPPKLMHVNEWARAGEDGNIEYAGVYEGWRREPSYALGAKDKGIPTSPFTAKQQLSFLSYQFRELEGLTGWAKNLVSDITTGSDVYNTDTPVLADAGQMTSPRVRFWETNQGGLFFSNEAIRRILPNQRSEVERVNPIMNSMPTWLPASFKYGDPYRNIEWGESRLPGAGYTALHPELRGMDPQDYPLIFQYSILADVAPHTSEFRKTRSLMYMRRQEGQTNEYENAYMDQIDERVRKKIDIYDFDRVHKNAIQLPGSGITQGVTFGIKQFIRKVAAPIEYMIPMGFRPIQKLMGDDRSAIEQYEYERLYGTPLAFWDKPIRDWFRPALYSAGNLLGYKGKPGWRRDADDNQEYFDKLDFVKWMKLAQEADKQGLGKEKLRYMYMAAGTRAGVNPQGNPLGIYWSLPDSERPFFNAFAQAQGGERKRILQMIPKDQIALYQSVWKNMDEGNDMFPGSESSVDQQYLTEKFYNLQQYFDSQPMPSEDWIGWHEDVDIEDIRVKYISEMGKELHDYGIWESQVKGLAAQPYLENSTQFLYDQSINRSSVWSNVRNLLPGQVTAHNSYNAQSRAHINYNDDRHEQIALSFREYVNGY